VFSLCLFLTAFVTADIFSQEPLESGKPKKITLDKQVWASPFKSQGTGGSCSIHRVISFLESEVFRIHQTKLELSQQQCHYYSYIEKMQRCLRFRDPNLFRKGGHFGDVLRVIKKYGAMPYDAYEGTLKKEDIANYKSLFGEITGSYIPYYQPGELLVRDNWLHDHDFYNLPVDDFIKTIDHAVNHGYSIAVDIHITEELYSDASKNYADYTEDEVVDQDRRDELFDNWQTSDVHLFHLIGIAHDESGKTYYLIKDSVGEEMGMTPPSLFSENYFRARVLAVMIHKDGIPKDIIEKLGLI